MNFAKKMVLQLHLLVLAMLSHAEVNTNAHWNHRFGSPGGSNPWITAVLEEAGRFYAGSLAVDGATNSVIQVWDGKDWISIGTVNGGLAYISDLIFFRGELHASGAFFNIDGIPSKGIARWDGRRWADVGGSLSGSGFSLATDGTFLYVGGQFTNAGPVAVNNVARWDGTSWSPLGAGLSGVVYDLLFANGQLSAGGGFTGSGARVVRGVGQWTGTQWIEVGGGISGQVFGLVSQDNKLWVAGEISAFGGQGGSHLGVWENSAWTVHPVLGVNARVSGITLFSNQVFITGSFTNVSGIPVSRVARWADGQWSALGRGFNNDGTAVRAGATGVLFGGLFSQADSLFVGHVARWAGGQWNAVGNPELSQGSAFAITDLLSEGADLYASGVFTGIGNVRANRIAKWDGTNWFALGNCCGFEERTVNLRVSALARQRTNLFAGGTFTNAGGIHARNIARWNGNSWSALGLGVNNTVWALAADSQNVYAGGTFTQAGGQFVDRIARWDGAQWWPLGLGVAPGQVNAIVIHGTDLYVGGTFTFAGDIDANGIARWDGTTWFPLGSGVKAPGVQSVSALAVRDGFLYVTGNFTNAGGVPANRVARWNLASRTWEALGTGVGKGTATANAVAFVGNEVYVAGTFTNAGSIEANAIAKWNGTNWSPLGSGLARPAGGANGSALAAAGNDVYVGGTFEFAGGKSSSSIAHWNESKTFNAPPAVMIGYPNPGSAVPVAVGAHIEVAAVVQDIEGAVAKVEYLIGTNKIGETTSSPFTFSWSPSGPGEYEIHLRVVDAGGRTSTSTPIRVLVTSAQAPLRLEARRSGGEIVLTVASQISRSAILQVSDSLTNWSDLWTTNTLNLEFREPLVSGSNRFYRLVLP